jgi:hypothetical protein
MPLMKSLDPIVKRTCGEPSSQDHESLTHICVLWFSQLAPPIDLLNIAPVELQAFHVKDGSTLNFFQQVGEGRRVYEAIVGSPLLILLGDQVTQKVLNDIRALRAQADKPMPIVVTKLPNGQAVTLAIRDLAEALYGDEPISLDIEDLQDTLNPADGRERVTELFIEEFAAKNMILSASSFFEGIDFDAMNGGRCFCIFSGSLGTMKLSEISKVTAALRDRLIDSSLLARSFRFDDKLQERIRISLFVSREA